jgi:hypothetical protein
MNMTVYKTNSALGYNQYAYLLRLNKSNNGYDYLCIDIHNIKDNDMYKVGEVVKDMLNNEVESSDYNIKESPIYNTFLFQEFLNKKPNRNIREVLPQMTRVSNNSVLTHELATALSQQLDLKTFKDLKLWLKIIERKITEKEREFRNNFFR